MIEPHHTSAFWDRVERIVPNYLERKRWLIKNGATHEL
ncbi:MAG: DUF45 domain-containing protein [Iphinoe sp. HA4291-MV1]|nr:DUF45 domain-containing protein [Iphinoe sp. HA4291-MV1]